MHEKTSRPRTYSTVNLTPAQTLSYKHTQLTIVLHSTNLNDTSILVSILDTGILAVNLLNQYLITSDAQ